MGFIHNEFLLTNDAAVQLYHEYAASEPILDFHNHLSPQEISENRRFTNLAEIWLEGDHYKWRALRANGIPEELITGNGDPKEKYLAWAATIPHTLGNPLYHWTHLELKRCFDIDLLLSPDTAEEIWAEANKQLAYPNFSACGMLERFQVKALCTTDDPAYPLLHHEQIAQNSSSSCKVYPTFRPDQSWGIDQAQIFTQWLKTLEHTSGKTIDHFNSFLQALAERLQKFHELGSRLSDHSFPYFFSNFPTEQKARQLFEQTLEGQDATREEKEQFGAFIMLYLCRWYSANNWTMQIHLGPLRNNSSRLLKTFGPDAGTDSMGDWAQAEKMSTFLDRLDQEDALPKTIVYNNNPSDNFVVSTMLGNFQRDFPGKMQFGSGWWHLDQRDGMEEQIKTLANTGLLSRFIGMLTDSRSFLSFPRHEYFRRILCNLLGTWMVEGFLPPEPTMIGDLVKRICYQNAKDFLNLEN
jgi:glucuronate isomerase|tara:strand:+ start:1373 stop:2776 length:1404 start_codon:yes stop_codon:yes gene_type:complete